MNETPVPTGRVESEPIRRHDFALALLEGALTKYRKNLSENAEDAQERYGFTLYHSLEAHEKIQHLTGLGFEPRDGIDHYNLGCVDALQGNFEDAITHFEKALAEDPQFAVAAHNLALTLERAGRTEQAKRQWARCLKLDLEMTDRAEIEAHLAELG